MKPKLVDDILKTLKNKNKNNTDNNTLNTLSILLYLVEISILLKYVNG